MGIAATMPAAAISDALLPVQNSWLPLCFLLPERQTEVVGRSFGRANRHLLTRTRRLVHQSGLSGRQDASWPRIKCASSSAGRRAADQPPPADRLVLCEIRGIRSCHPAAQTCRGWSAAPRVPPVPGHGLHFVVRIGSVQRKDSAARGPGRRRSWHPGSQRRQDMTQRGRHHCGRPSLLRRWQIEPAQAVSCVVIQSRHTQPRPTAWTQPRQSASGRSRV